MQSHVGSAPQVEAAAENEEDQAPLLPQIPASCYYQPGFWGPTTAIAGELAKIRAVTKQKPVVLHPEYARATVSQKVITEVLTQLREREQSGLISSVRVFNTPSADDMRVIQFKLQPPNKRLKCGSLLAEQLNGLSVGRGRDFQDVEFFAIRHS